MYQSTTNDIIRFRCAAAHTTTALDVSCYSKVLDKATGRLEELVPVCTVSNGTTNVTISASPATGKNKGVESLSIVNLDTVTHTVIIEWYNGTVARRQHAAELAAGETLVYGRGDWSVYNPTGKEILVGATGATGAAGATGATGAGVPTGGLTGEVLAKNSNTNYDTAWVAAAAGIADGDKGDLTVSSSGTVWTIATNVVTNAKSAQMVGRTMKGNSTDSTANASDLTIAQINALLNLDAIRFNLVQ